MSYENLKIVILNGPSQSGKNSIARVFLNNYDGFHMQFSRPLKDAVHAFLGLYNCKHDEFDDTEDEISARFREQTPRQAYIDMSDFVKKAYGIDILGKLIRNRIINTYHRMNLRPRKGYISKPVVILAECGRIEELTPLLKEFPSQSFHIFRMHRQGYNFKDYRDYILGYNFNGELITDIYNVTQPNAFVRDKFLLSLIQQHITPFINSK